MTHDPNLYIHFIKLITECSLLKIKHKHQKVEVFREYLIYCKEKPLNNFIKLITEAYSELYQAPKMEPFAKRVN